MKDAVLDLDVGHCRRSRVLLPQFAGNRNPVMFQEIVEVVDDAGFAETPFEVTPVRGGCCLVFRKRPVDPVLFS